jgi:uncharacterized protein (UPF0548 family)
VELNVFRSSDLTYAEVGASEFLPLPSGYSHLRYRLDLGAVSFDAAAEAIETFALHRAAHVRMVTDAPRAEPGVRVTAVVGLGRLRMVAPCEVVAVFADPDRRGFAYGTLAGHPERGEEAFLVTRSAGGSVVFEVRAFSAPARWYAKVGSPLVPVFQRLYAWNLGRTLRRLLG